MPQRTHLIVIAATLVLFASSGARAEDSYGDTIRLKLGSGFSNLFLGILEVPKNMVKTSNEVNLLFGVTGGTVKGTAHFLGRTLSGVADVFTFPVPTKPITTPPFVWQDWYVDTQYGPFFPIKKQTQPPAATTGMPPARPKY